MLHQDLDSLTPSRSFSRRDFVRTTVGSGFAAAVLAQLKAAFGRACLPLNLPQTQPGGGPVQVVDAFFNRAGTSDFGPVEAAHRALVEQVVEVDSAFVDRYLNDGDVDVYLCGPPPMVEACIGTLMQGRLFERDIYTEKFLSAADAQATRSPLFQRV